MPKPLWTTSPPPGPPAERPPTLRVAPQRPRVSTAGGEAVELAASAGIILDGWQADVLDLWLSEDSDGGWCARECGLVVPRQQGKGVVLTALQLWSLFIGQESLTIASAHLYATAAESFLRLRNAVESTPHLARLCRPARLASGTQAIETLAGNRVRFMARGKQSARGFTCNRLIFDEAQFLHPEVLAAQLPALSAVRNAQVCYAATAPPFIDDRTQHLRSLRARAVSDSPGALAWVEWSTPADMLDPADPAVWERANPALGTRISFDAVAAEQATLSPEAFATERLGVWPPGETASRVIPEAWWLACEDPGSEIVGVAQFGVDVSPDRRMCSVSVAGRNAQGLLHVELVDRRPAVGWVIPRLVELSDRYPGCSVSLDPAGPAGSLVPELRAAGVDVVEVTMRDHARSCGILFDAVEATAAAVADGTLGTFRHLGQTELAVALAGADRRPLGDAWAFSRRHSASDITCLVASALAVFRVVAFVEPEPEPRRKVFAF